MSDELTRELERRWKETGAVEDEARLLAEKVRSGTLPQSRLDLAAACGHPAACAVTAKAPLIARAASLTDVALVVFKQFGVEVALRVAAIELEHLARCPERFPWAQSVGDVVASWIEGRESHDAVSSAWGEANLGPWPPVSAGPFVRLARQAEREHAYDPREDRVTTTIRPEGRPDVRAEVVGRLLRWALG